MSDFHLDRSIFIRASRATVWSFFEDSELFARWWGEGSTIEARVGAPFLIRYPNGDTASGEILELDAPAYIAFSYGYDQEGKPIPPGGSRVEIRLSEKPGGTLVALRHIVGDEATRDMHVAGWNYQLAVFAKVVSEKQHEGLGAMVERWFVAWNAEDEGEREKALAACTTEDVRFADAFGNTERREALVQHIANVRRFVPAKLVQMGAPRQALGTAIVDWEMQGPDGAAVGKGSNVMELDGSGRIASVVGVPG